MKKKLLLILPNFFRFDQPIKRNLEFCGFEVTDKIYDLEKPFTYRGFGQRAYNFFLKTFLRQKDSKIKLVLDNNNRQIEESLSGFKKDHFDFSLFFVVQFFDESLISRAKTVSAKTIAYQFDSIKRTPQLVKNIPLYDDFYSFDKNDVRDYPVQFATNFYFDYDLKEQYPKTIDFFYIGTFVEERMPLLLKMIDVFRDCGFNYKIMLFAHNKELLKPYLEYGIEIQDKLLTYEEQEEMASKARVLIDLKLSVHDGLSFRFFEAMKFKSKIMTTNPTVKEYDFFSEKNVLVVDAGDEIFHDDVRYLLHSPFDNEKEEIFKNYSFTGWAKKILQ